MKSIIFLLFCSVLYQCTYQDKVNVTLIYESLCPFCIDFVTRQLYPGFQKLGDALIIDLVPFANQKEVDNKWVFDCQHGPQECYASKIQSCVLKHYPDIATQMNFLECMMNSSDPVSAKTGEHCANSCNIPWAPIEKCSNGLEADEILAAYRQQALAQHITYVPYLLFNGVYNEMLANAAMEHFVKTVCDLLKTKPKGCFAELEN